MNKLLLLGAEAIALGALDAGISGVYAYPGTPSTEITEFIQRDRTAREKGVRSSWSSNEKTAYEAALGMSYTGKRTLVCMKHVGLNVAADAFINSAITGVNGGLVLAVADDPSMHSSQNEQDSRVYGKFAMVPVLEPVSQQELYDAMSYGFDLSESLGLPVMIRLTTRLSHSRAGVERKEPREQNRVGSLPSSDRFVLMPHNARKQYDLLLDMQPVLEERSEQSWLNRLIPGSGKTGVLAFGIAWNYVMEVRQTYGLDCPILKISQYPPPRKQIKALFDSCDTVLVAEEGYPVYEELLRGYFDNSAINGRLDGTLPRAGELSADNIRSALGITEKKGLPIPSIM
ncbi:MAG: indolepyruvate ferredoxin oxidoreductase, partial [Chlorobiaceae bacterium]|nr:indolepyruvate ferredoxin oxidoreductase [Chlorobiaceae bacterium]